MKNVVFLGLVSFFSDFSTEMVYPLISIYLTASLGATPALVGVIEGIAESVASLLKVFSGYISDKLKRKKPFAFYGYAAGLVYKLALIFASSWAGILVARVIDRIGKGIRTAPRDSLVAESGGKGLGGAFGLHKALDMAGSAVGILCSYLLLIRSGADSFDYRRIFALSMIPAIFGLAAMLFVKEPRAEKKPQKTREPFWRDIKKIPRPLLRYLLITLVFTLGNSSNSFLLLRAKSAGYTDVTVVLLYFIYNASASVLAVPLGRLSDRVGRRSLLAFSYAMFAAVYLGFAFAGTKAGFIAAFAAYGVYAAASAGAERALIAEIAPEELRGAMLGLQSTVAGVALLPASVIAGLLMDKIGASAPFIFGAVMSAAACVMLLLLFPKKSDTIVS